jgi:cysteine desulfurase / selenocysteine lyase
MSHKQDFVTTGGTTYLNTGSEGLLLKASCDALQSYCACKREGSAGRAASTSIERQCRAGVATLMGVPCEAVGFTSSASEGLNLLANSLDWKAGDEVLLTDLEHPTNILPWLRLRRAPGVLSRVVPSRDGKLYLEDITTRLTNRTRLVTVSLVSYRNGFRINFLSDLAQAVHDRGCLLCVDATQAVGRIAVDVSNADFLVASGYKWLCGIHGLGVVCGRLDSLAQLHPGSLGWRSVEDPFGPERFDSYTLKSGAARLQPGMSNFPALYALHASVSYVNQVGIGKIEKSLLPLMRHLYQGLVGMGLSLLTPPEEPFWSGMFSFASSEAETIGHSLAERGVLVWSGDGRVRISVHLYNDASDIEALLQALREVLQKH